MLVLKNEVKKKSKQSCTCLGTGGHLGHVRQPAVSGHATVEHSQRQRVPIRLLDRLRVVVRDGQTELRGGARTTRGLPGVAHCGGWQQAGPATRPQARDRGRRLRVAVLRAAENEASVETRFSVLFLTKSKDSTFK